jgi:hypothetical protein
MTALLFVPEFLAALGFELLGLTIYFFIVPLFCPSFGATWVYC